MPQHQGLGICGSVVLHPAPDHLRVAFDPAYLGWPTMVRPLAGATTHGQVGCRGSPIGAVVACEHNPLRPARRGDNHPRAQLLAARRPQGRLAVGRPPPGSPAVGRATPVGAVPAVGATVGEQGNRHLRRGGGSGVVRVRG
ncbi:hypothetical protein B296_00014791 [Ensete ventricosum]|uniref:Uncharacterized protein n=1 Tax=Ensete ventricosum TaxID=4639 RepID=A0A426ZQ22_ENSVE|nr:hypothetical protein B296_00014791 [Ensete ventricosum]